MKHIVTLLFLLVGILPCTAQELVHTHHANEYGGIWIVELSHDGNFLAIGKRHGWEIMDLRDFSIVYQSELQDEEVGVHSFDFSPDDSKLLIAFPDKTIEEWDWQSGEKLRSINAFKEDTVHGITRLSNVLYNPYRDGLIVSVNLKTHNALLTYDIGDTLRYIRIMDGLGVQMTRDHKYLVLPHGENILLYNQAIMETGDYDNYEIRKFVRIFRDLYKDLGEPEGGVVIYFMAISDNGENVTLYAGLGENSGLYYIAFYSIIENKIISIIQPKSREITFQIDNTGSFSLTTVKNSLKRDLVLKDINTQINYTLIKDSFLGSREYFESHNLLLRYHNGDLFIYSFNIQETIDHIANVENNDQLNNLVIYPNPTTGTLNLEFESNKSESSLISLSDINGIELINFGQFFIQTGINNIELDISTVPNGTYFVKIHSTPQINFKVIKE